MLSPRSLATARSFYAPDWRVRGWWWRLPTTATASHPRIQGKVFDPFFTTRPVGQGAGLGLTTAHSIIDKHKGQIRLESKPGATVFEVRLPVNFPARMEK